MSSLNKLLVIYGYKHIFGKDGSTYDVIAQKVAEYNLDSLLQSISKISLKLSIQSQSDIQTQISLVRDIFANNQETRKKIHDILNNNNEPWIIFSRQSTLELFHLALNHSKKTGGRLVSPDEVQNIGIILLEITDVAMNYKDLTYPEVRRHLIKQFCLNFRERLVYRIARFRIMFRLMSKNDDKLDIKNNFRLATKGINFSDYISLCFYFMVKWINLGDKKDLNIMEEWVIDKNKYFSETKLSKTSIDRIVDFLVLDKDKYAEQYEKSLDFLKGEKCFGYNFLTFKKYPFISIDKNKFVCPYPDFLMDRATEGVYWIVENYFRHKELVKEHKMLPSLWGEAFEKYINKRLIFGFKKKYIAKPITKDFPNGVCDGIICGANYIFLIEIKYIHWDNFTQATGIIEYDDDVCKKLFGPKNGLGQLKIAGQKIQLTKYGLDFDIQNKKIIPVLVVGEPMLQEVLCRKFYENAARYHDSIFKHKNVLPFIILNTEEVEGLEALAKINCDQAEKWLSDYSKLFLNKDSSGLIKDADTFTNYLTVKNLYLPKNKYLYKVFKKLTDKATKKAFAKKI